jgi:glycosyltransferase involved in cell wall biosynthesis
MLPASVFAILPAHNEADTIADAIESLKEAKKSGAIAGFVVVANGCTDRTVKVARSLGAKVIVQKEANKGKAFIKGTFLAAKAKAKVVLTVDADAARFSKINVWALTHSVLTRQAKMAIAECSSIKGEVSYPAEFSGFRAISMETLKPILANNREWVNALTSTPYSLERGLNIKILGNLEVNLVTTGENHFPGLSGNIGVMDNLLGKRREGEIKRVTVVEAGFKVKRNIRAPTQIGNANFATSRYFFDRVLRLKKALGKRRLANQTKPKRRL